MNFTVLAMLGNAAAKYAKRELDKWAREDACDRGEWRGKAHFHKLDARELDAAGYDASAEMYRVRLDDGDPLRFYSYETKHEYRPALAFDCDFGSIPEPFQEITLDGVLNLDPLAYKMSYGTHDSGYACGGLWVRDPADSHEWVFVKMPRVHVDVVLLWGLSAEGADNATLQMVYRAVRAGAGFAWKEHRKTDDAAH